MFGMRHKQYVIRSRRSHKPPKWLIPILLAAIVLLCLAGLFLRTSDAAVSVPSPVPVAAVPAPLPPVEPTLPKPSMPPPPPEVHGIYISGPIAGDPYMDTLLALIDGTELNAVVIDVKNDEGNLTYLPETGTAVELGACVRYIQDLPGLVTKLKEHGVYTIARIAAFKDPVLAKARPELSLRRSDGGVVSENGGPAWVNPYEEDVRDYLTEVALGAAEAGFDEIQFDYIRFPTGKAAQEADYGPASQGVSREDMVADFLESVCDTLHKEGVWVSADVFGTVIHSEMDAGLIGQDYTRMAEIVDFICPMVYPSHYAPGTFDLEIPDQEPYLTVLTALKESRESLSKIDSPQSKVRAWLQDFTATWVTGHLNYGGEELRAQIQAVYDAGYTDWILWNAQNGYTSDGLLLPKEGYQAQNTIPYP